MIIVYNSIAINDLSRVTELRLKIEEDSLRLTPEEIGRSMDVVLAVPHFGLPYPNVKSTTLGMWLCHLGLSKERVRYTQCVGPADWKPL